MKTLITTVTLIVLSISAFAQSPLPDPAKVLDRYIGTWTLTYSKPANLSLTERYEYVIRGGYIRKSVSPPNDASAMAMVSMQMLSFNKAKGVYQLWSFPPGAQYEGKWDPASKALTWIAHDDATDYTTVIKATAINNDTDDFSIVTTDGSGKVIDEKIGRRTRTK